MIENGVNGFVFPQGNTTALADLLVRLAQEPQLRVDVGERGRSIAGRFEPEVVAGEVRRVYDAIVPRAATRAVGAESANFRRVRNRACSSDQHRSAGMAERIAEMESALLDLAPTHLSAASPEEADVILVVEPFQNKFRPHIDLLRAFDSVRRFPNKCFVYESSDRPVTFLPGLYVSLPRRRQDTLRTRPVAPWAALDFAVRETVIAATPEEPQLLFSFRGFRSAEVRSAILECWRSTRDVRISETTRWWDYSVGERDQVEYLTEIRMSKFVLCPRGAGTSSNRLYEVMQLGRVPVILADDWDPPSNIPWEDFSIRVAESQAPRLRDILERSAPNAEAMGARALAAWRESCEPGRVLLDTLLAAVDDIVRSRPGGWDESSVHGRWRSADFLWANGIHPVQGAYGAYRAGDFGARVKRKLRDSARDVIERRPSGSRCAAINARRDRRRKLGDD